MQVHKLEDKNKLFESVLTFGNFDGIHRGHAYIIDKLISISKKEDLKSVLITFEPHTTSTLRNDNNFKIITPFNKKISVLERFNLDVTCKINFNKKFSELSAATFIDIIIKKYNPKIILIGYDNYFGHKKEGSYKYLSRNDKYSSIKIININQFKYKNINVKSSLIKDFIMKSDISNVNNLINRQFSIDGKVIKGENISNRTGFKTANIKLLNNEQLIPGNGVYSVNLRIANIDYVSICNIGYCPTIKNSSVISIEVHVINECFDLYDKYVELFFISYIRPEKKFENVIQLKKQILIDIDSTKGKEYGGRKEK